MIDIDTHARALLDANSYVVLSTAEAEGNPWATPVWFAPPTGWTGSTMACRSSTAGQARLRLYVAAFTDRWVLDQDADVDQRVAVPY